MTLHAWPLRAGSSPRSRGTLRKGLLRDDEDRFIPALAGNVARTSTHGRGAAVHPRARGERYTSAPGTWYTTGSSPRSRGTWPRAAGDQREDRFIPALAGNVAPSPSSSPKAPVHPRARGERVRRVLRFIGGVPVHPRARGERERFARAGRDLGGSSPRSRGTFPLQRPGQFDMRFIPALAGNVGGGSAPHDDAPVHPRARGERARSSAGLSGSSGSSPRSRGTSEVA